LSLLSLRSLFEKVVGKMEGIEERSARRRRIIVGHVAKDFADAERWDLEFWQSQTPQERIDAALGIQREKMTGRTKSSAGRRRKTRG
jgi:hypothetical protein